VSKAFLFIFLALGLAVEAHALQFLPEWRPFGDVRRFALHGDYQIIGKRADSGFSQTLTIEPDALLTDTFRLHARWRPLNNELFLVRGKAVQGVGANALNNQTLERLFFEGRWLGLDIAGGRLPFEFHNLYMAQDDVQGILIARNNYSILSLPNIRILFFGTALGANSQLTGNGRENRDVGLYGVDTVVDTTHYTIETTLGYLHDNTVHQDEQYGGLSVVRVSPTHVTSLRIFGNWDKEKEGVGVVIEQSFVFFSAMYMDRPTLYLNSFWGNADFQSMANGSFKNIGFLFNSVGGAPQLDNMRSDALGFATGILLGKSRDFTITPEIAALFDQSSNGDNQVGAGVRTQIRMFDTSFLRVDVATIHQANKPNQVSTTAQIVYKF